MLHQKLIETALSCGATKATIIESSQIVLSKEFLNMCAANSCGYYNKCWMCPPDIGNIDDLMEKVRKYSYGLWYQTIGELEDSFDIEGMGEAADEHLKLSLKLQEAVKPLFTVPFLHLSKGGCHICPTCAKRTNEPCRFPDKALSSLEAHGVDVYQTTQSTDLKYINGPNTVTYFGMVLFNE